VLVGIIGLDPLLNYTQPLNLFNPQFHSRQFVSELRIATKET